MCWDFSFGMEERQPNSSINRTFESSFLFQWSLMTFFCKNPIVWNYRHITYPDSSVGNACNAGDPGLIPGSGRSPGEGIGYPLQYSWASLAAQLVMNPPAMWETWVWFLGWEVPVGEGKGYPLQYSGLENSTDCRVHGVSKSWTWLSDFHFHIPS